MNEPLKYGFSIVYKDASLRYDKAPVLYILLDNPINPEKNDYKGIVKEIIARFNQQMPQYSAYIYDEQESLNLHYRHYTAKLGRLLSRDETDHIASHCIAAYDRGLKTGKTPNSIAFYPATIPENKEYQYFEEFEYNPMTGI